MVIVHQKMAFTKLSMGSPNKDASTPSPNTDIWTIFRALRDARKEFGLRSAHIQTLQAMLSFLKPGHGNTVFASNGTICQRVGGIDERTLRRHIGRFVELGFLKRNNSPNGKRYRIRSSDGLCISYGLSLSPLIERADELQTLAENIEHERRDCIFLRKQILVKLAHLEEFAPENALPQEVRKLLRRTLTLNEHQAILSRTDIECNQVSTAVDEPETLELPVKDGQIDRHHSTSTQIRKDLERSETTETPEFHELTSVCKEASSFSTKPLQCWRDVESHARYLAPMMGIDPKIFEQAKTHIGAKKTSCAIFIMLQLGDKIRDFGAYFHSITLGRKQTHFDPKALLKRMAQKSCKAA